jgi:2,4-dienoyl-CoA reductase-like NADH-dependent reductase (Old Yellow Enzyme family)
MPFPLLFAPITIRGHEVRNRAVITSHGASEAFRSPALPPDTYIEYLRRRAASAGLIITQPPFFNPGVQYPSWLVDRHAALVEAVHSEGAVVLLQLAHLGAFARSDADVHRPPLWGFSATQSAAGETSHEMTDDEILLMVDAYRATAAMAVAAGFDGVEIHGGHGYLVQQSLTPFYNSREDRWGADRSLFARTLIAAARSELGAERIIGYRTTTDDMRDPADGGIGFRAGADLLARLLGTGELDLLNTTIGDGGPSYARAIPDYRSADAPNIAAIARLRTAVAIEVPVIGVGRIASPGVAEAVLASGTCDLVAMTRAHIADPDLLVKVAAGQAHRVRPCVGANVCVNRKLAGFGEISCLHNPEVLREKELAIRPAQAPRRILVVGAGPAGLKAAEVAAKRGHDVQIYDAGAQPGGRLRHAAGTAAAALVSSVEYLLAELATLDLKVIQGRVTESLLRELAPDEVILATGARPDVEAAFPGALEAGAIDSSLALQAKLGQRVLVYDTVGANEGALVAEALARQGRTVSFVTPYELAMPQGGQLHRVQLPETLYARVDRVIVRGMVALVADGVALVATPEGTEIASIQADSIVVVTPPAPDVELVAVLKELGIAYRLAGDVVAPRLAMQAYKDGHEAGLAV